ncbi:MAG: (Fe-S)-binding protein [Chloroflexota bacterium]
MDATELRTFALENSLFRCIQCGKCAASCPMGFKTILNPRKLVYATLISGELDPVAHQELWDCTTCFSCSVRCPKDVDPGNMVIQLRSFLIEDGRLQKPITDALRSVYERGNPLGYPARDRGKWAEELEVKHLDDGAETFCFIGCMPSFDLRGNKVAQATVNVLQAAGEDIAILAEDERCCGSEVRRLGEQGEDSLFEAIIEDWEEDMEDYEFKQIVAISPHCFDVFKHHYPLNGKETLHYTQRLAQLIDEGKLTFSGKVEGTVTYHDPCYLGKQNGIYDEPRAVLKAIPGLKVVEMDRNREKSLCCEGGGGRSWIEDPVPEKKLAAWRVDEAMEVGANIIATACPFCMQMLEDAIRTADLTDKIQVLDIVELAEQAL